MIGFFLLAVLITISFATAHGQVMQTRAKIETTWGSPTKRLDGTFPVTEQCAYKTGGWSLAVSYMKDSAIKVIYVKANVSAITEAEINTILAANRKVGDWIVTDRLKEATAYKNQKDHVEAVVSSTMIILTNSTIASVERGE